MVAASRVLMRSFEIVVMLGLLCWACGGGRAVAQQVAFQSYGKAEGLTNAWFSCLHQDKSGYIFACTEHGLYSYDGRRFFNFGPRQGLPDGGLAEGMAVDAAGRLILRYPHSIFVSTTAIGPHTPPEALAFRVATSMIGPIPDDGTGQLVRWEEGAVFAGQGQLFLVRTEPDSGRPVVELAGGLLHQPGLPLQDLSPLAADGSTLWAVRTDGSICGLGTASARCFGPSDGLPSDTWVALLLARDGHVLARSASRLADMDPRTGRVDVSLLPDQGGRYANYPKALLLALTPSGQLVTQSADGLMIRETSGWKTLTTANGLPPAPILRLTFDRQGDLWLGVLGRGVMRALGYGSWANFDHHDGLSNDVLWQMARQPDGPLWVASDGGVDAIDGPAGAAVSRRHYDGAAFSIALGGFGHLWRSVGSTAVACVTLSTGDSMSYPLPQVSQILHGSGSRLWFVTEKGVYFVDGAAAPTAPQPIAGLAGSVTSAAVAADASLWVLRGQELLHRHADGSIVSIDLHWPQPQFEPLTLAAGSDGTMWIAGAGGGFYRFQLAGDRVLSSTRFQPPDVVSNSIVSLLVDSRGWLWAGTDNGLSVFNGRRWVSATTADGLIWDDLDQGSLLEDADGSMWIGTSQGLSHLLDPEHLFYEEALRPVVTSVTISGTTFRERAVPYTREPLFVEFGALDLRADTAIRFRYRLDGVDRSWADTANGYARYASVPPGHHRFEVVAYDPLTHQVSAPASILLRVREPWWLWWPLLVLYGLIGLGLIYGGLRLRFRYLLRQRRMLQREVEVQTREIREAQAALRLQATQDSLTKLLTRGEIQSRLIAALTDAEGSVPLTVGMLDIDHFKRINDRLGHLAGDEILQEIGRRLTLTLELGEDAGRYGGEEMLIVVRSEPEVGLERIATFKAAVCNTAFVLEHEVVAVTCSIGVAHACSSDDWKSLIGRADRALYQAKHQGRDRIVAASTVEPPAQPRDWTAFGKGPSHA